MITTLIGFYLADSGKKCLDGIHLSIHLDVGQKVHHLKQWNPKYNTNQIKSQESSKKTKNDHNFLEIPQCTGHFNGQLILD